MYYCTTLSSMMVQCFKIFRLWGFKELKYIHLCSLLSDSVPGLMFFKHVNECS
jgi:hypothetical protein